MSYKKEHQPPLTIDEQIENLKNLGLIINDKEYARAILNDISYFRLIKAYSLNLKKKNGTYNDGVTFEHIVELYLFNANFRQLLFPLIEKIEINLRCRISNHLANKYGTISYIDNANFANQEYHEKFIKDIKEEIQRNSKTLFVRNFQENYKDGCLPIYALVEILSFGRLSQLYKNLKNEDKKEIAKDFNVGYTYLESWVESISYVRNICAHYERLYNRRLFKTPMLYKQYSRVGIANNKIFGLLTCIKELLKNDKVWKDFIERFEEVLEKYNNIDIKTMGFVDCWDNYLIEDTKNV